MFLTSRKILQESWSWRSFVARRQRISNATAADEQPHESDDSTTSGSADDNPYLADFEKHYIPSTPAQKLILSAGSAIITLLNPGRPDALGVFGETSGQLALQRMHEKMMASNEGQQILLEKPRINSRTVDLDALKKLPPNTFGRAYIKFLEDNKVTPDTRTPVQFVDDIELAYVMQRYREVHDLVHTVLGMPTNMLGEVAVKWVEGIQTGLPMCMSGAILGPLRFKTKQRQRYLKSYLPWALSTAKNAEFLLNVYYEKRWEQPMGELLREIKIEPFIEI
ncbi:ubiquinone biosynthesis protein COQ4 homolog, mitochondrial [Neocloeon triangulifer]|uniref:ubiquinone biosynthesis protein COQ4 homolog, mitochondrial n=1 Tax=Neocloeon triangulifer TaxID=2078957 RepID=UPI00286F6F88|nr:ubiquinone biosynthesis protein COQ4 homolog, mitochondrial [Neocloeon triangulifer]